MEDNDKYKILIVDEDEDQIEDFKRFFESRFDVVSLSSLEDDSELFKIIADEEVSAVAFDYKLKETNSSFAQNGDVYQRMLLDNFDNFPTFIVTNNTSDSRQMNTDPFKVIDKAIIYYDPHDNEQKKEAEELLEKVYQLIHQYHIDIQDSEVRLLELIEKEQSGQELTPQELKQMVDLDSKLENTISKASRIPKEWKSPAALDAFSRLVANSEDIIRQLKQISGE